MTLNDSEDFKNEVYRRLAAANGLKMYFGAEMDRQIIGAALEVVRDHFMAKAGEDNTEWWPPSQIVDQVHRWIP